MMNSTSVHNRAIGAIQLNIGCLLDICLFVVFDRMFPVGRYIVCAPCLLDNIGVIILCR